VLGKAIEHEYNLFELLRRPEVSYASLLTLPGAGEGNAIRWSSSSSKSPPSTRATSTASRRSRQVRQLREHRAAGRPRLRHRRRPVQ
jgi:hypothetical protein